MDNVLVWLLNNFIWFSGLYTYYLTENILYVFGVMGIVNFIYFIADEIWAFMCK